jgi:RNA polymerase sigma-70 factor (ECF subfamily)
MTSNQIEAIKAGDTNAFGIFFRNHYPRLLKYCRLFIFDLATAEDMVQETFIQLWEKRSILNPESSLEALLFISLRNRCLNHLRDQKLNIQRLKEYQSKTHALQIISHLDYLGEEDIPLEERLIRELNIAINNLPNRCRNVVRLAKLEGLKNKEVAAQLGISVKAVERQLAIGRRKIEDHIRKHYPLALPLFLAWFS